MRFFLSLRSLRFFSDLTVVPGLASIAAALLLSFRLLVIVSASRLDRQPSCWPVFCLPDQRPESPVQHVSAK
jgi:hypothetical protein